MGINWVDLVNLSIIIQMKSCWIILFGNPTTKSTVIWSHMYSRIQKICIFSCDHWCLIFICWQIKHINTNSTTSPLMPFHQLVQFHDPLYHYVSWMNHVLGLLCILQQFISQHHQTLMFAAQAINCHLPTIVNWLHAIRQCC